MIRKNKRSKKPGVTQADLLEDLQLRASRGRMTREQFMQELARIQEEVEKAESGGLAVGALWFAVMFVVLFFDPENQSWVVGNVVLFAVVFVAARWRRLQKKVRRLREAGRRPTVPGGRDDVSPAIVLLSNGEDEPLEDPRGRNHAPEG